VNKIFKRIKFKIIVVIKKEMFKKNEDEKEFQKKEPSES
jgi:hypothetical protein